MKKIKVLLLAASIISIGLSCKKGIAEDPKGFLNDKTLFNTEFGAKAALMGVYERMSTYYYFGNQLPQCLSFASGAFWASVLLSQNEAKQAALPTDDMVRRPWLEMYSGISAVNGLIDGLLESPLTGKTRDNILGEAYFLRAIYYFNAVRIWGAVPLRLHLATDKDVDMARTPADQIYAQVISDLQQAKLLMPDPAGQVKGRPNKFAAFSLLAKVYLTMAGNDQASPNWQKAYDEAIQVYNSGAYKLVRPFKDLWDVNKENSVESIFEIQYTTAGGSSNGLTQSWMPTSSSYILGAGSPLARVRVQKMTFDDHRNTYPGDPRINASYIHTTYNSKSGTPQQVYPSPTATAANGYPYLLKYNDPNWVANGSNTNLIYLRYADVLLMLAEIENELRGPAGAYKYINEVMHRARDANGNGTIEVTETSPADWSGMTQATFRDRIMLERRIELVGEVHEFYDTRRRGESYLLKYYQQHNSHPLFNATNDFLFPTDAASVKKNLLLPIPAEEFNYNRLLTPADQNFGY
ncbi:MAG: RagB/SusD family nutrient uptake outer membrane protein [Chitinophagaceae bacterium]|nr:MAG: RagB/SusD family nutrient uptake outer membrane protein [Chitinophagaceae bacterium]